MFLATIVSTLLAVPAISNAGPSVQTSVSTSSHTQVPVRLGLAGTFALLSKSGITDVYASSISGDVGSSPITGAAIGLSCGEVGAGIIYTVDAAGPQPCSVTAATLLTAAVGDMEAACTDAAGVSYPISPNSVPAKSAARPWRPACTNGGPMLRSPVM